MFSRSYFRAPALGLIFLLQTSSMGYCRAINPFKAPKFSIKTVHYKHISFSGVDLEFVLLVDNPNFIGLTVKKLKYELLLDDERFAEGFKDKAIEISGSKISTINLPVRINYDGLSDSIGTLFNEDEISYKLIGYIVIDSPIGEIKFDFEDYDFHKGAVPIPKLPTLAVQEVSIKEFSFTNIEIQLWFNLKNTNDFTFNLKELRYLFSINNRTVSKALVQSSATVKPGEEVQFKIPINLKLTNLKIGILKALRQRAINYKLLVNVIIDSNDKEIKLPLKEIGSLKLIRD